MNKENSPVLDKILNGHKFKIDKPHLKDHYFQIEQEQTYVFKNFYRYEANGGLCGLEGTLDEMESHGNMLVVFLHGFGKISRIYLDCTFDLELIDG